MCVRVRPRRRVFGNVRYSALSMESSVNGHRSFKDIYMNLITDVKKMVSACIVVCFIQAASAAIPTQTEINALRKQLADQQEQIEALRLV